MLRTVHVCCMNQVWEQHVFDHYDIDGKGFLDMDELGHLAQVATTFRPPPPDLPASSARLLPLLRPPIRRRCVPLRIAAPLSPVPLSHHRARSTPSHQSLHRTCVYATTCVLAAQQHHRHDLRSRVTLK